MKNTILILIIAFTSLTSCKNEPKEKKETEAIERKTVESKKVDDTEKINQVFEQFESLYKELIEFKDDSDFKKYGFGKGGKNYEWLNKVRDFKSNPDSKLLLKKGVLIGELEQLGMAYANSNGKDTDVTKTFNKIFSDVISSNTETKTTETQKKTTLKQITTEKFTIIKDDKNERLKKVNIDVRLDKEISKIELKKIGLKIKEERPEFDKFWIFYYLPEHKTGNGAWAITHFKPELEIEILGATQEASKEMNEKKVTGTILNIWNDNDAIMPNKIYLVNENDKLFVKTIYAKNSYSEATEIINEVTEVKRNGLIRYNYDNNHGDYYVLEKNGNLGLYDDEGKFKEAIKKK